VDTAGSTKDITRESKGKPHSWSVAGVWDFKRLGDSAALIARDVWRDRVGFVEMCDRLRTINRDWKPSRIIVEDATMGPDLADVLRNELPIELIPTGGKGKVERATLLLNMLSKGQVFLPKGNTSWRHPLEAEWLSWQGLDDETNDQVDMAAYAAIHADRMNVSGLPMRFEGHFKMR
jgi:phage terminase large subunit-like protein